MKGSAAAHHARLRSSQKKFSPMSLKTTTVSNKFQYLSIPEKKSLLYAAMRKASSKANQTLKQMAPCDKLCANLVSSLPAAMASA
mmetsp:Transcript_484/g.773  ORF Transcript_484/g.773 Transcript_484/m.773 type:complete len:85 (-) Transcript_484:41-295(-)